MKRRAFINRIAMTGAASILPTATTGMLLQGCREEQAPLGWNFDEVIDRSGTWSIKYGRVKPGQYAMWIADMDFPTDPYVHKALQERLDKEVLGYTIIPDEYYESICAWESKQNGWDIPREWVGYAPGVITGINQAYLTFTQPGDKIIVQPPVYDHFKMYAQRLGREVVDNPLIFENGHYRMDFEGLESLMDERTKVLVLCHPHNPCGISWDKDSLIRLADICERHGVIVISDEIHSDLTLFDHKHLPFCSVSEAAARVGVILTGPTKAFNLAGLSATAYCIIPDQTKREQFFGTLKNAKLDEPSIPTIVATIAAYTSSSGWLPALKEYIQGNVECVMQFFEEHQLGITPIRPDASFLIWLDCRSLGLTQEELLARFRDQAGVYLSDGASYGQGGEGFVRLNIGCPRSLLQAALEQVLIHF